MRSFYFMIEDKTHIMVEESYKNPIRWLRMDLPETVFLQRYQIILAGNLALLDRPWTDDTGAE